MKGKHEMDVVKLQDQQILQLMSSRLGLDVVGEVSAGHLQGQEEAQAAQPGPPVSSDSRDHRDAATLHVPRRGREERRSTLKQILPKKNIVTSDQNDWADKLIPSFQLGIDLALSQTANELRDLLFHDFFFIEIIQFSPTVLNRLGGDRIEAFTLKAVAPMAFAHFRKLFNVHEDAIRSSICTEPLTMVMNAGASGSIFYVTHDREFVLKTVTKKEARFLQELLPEYYMNIHQNPNTFLPRFYGLFVVKRYTCVMRLVVMNNIIRPGHVLHKFDLKGSRYHRRYRPEGKGAGDVSGCTPTLKDLDFLEVFPSGLVLPHDVHDIVAKTLDRDVLVLQSFAIMDYSLLLAIRRDEPADLVASVAEVAARRRERTFAAAADESFCDIHRRHNCHAPNCCTRRLSRRLAEIVLPCGGIPATDENGTPLVIYMGIIDILQDYGIKKMVEHFLKSLCLHSDVSEISVQPQGFYAIRFTDFIKQNVFHRAPEPSVPAPSATVPRLPSVVVTPSEEKRKKVKKRQSEAPELTEELAETLVAEETEAEVGEGEVEEVISSRSTEEVTTPSPRRRTEGSISKSRHKEKVRLPSVASRTRRVSHKDPPVG